VRFADVDELVRTRLAAMTRFLADYPGPGASPRYIDAALPNLPFDDEAFDLALVSHLLFTYSEHLDADAHRAGLCELMRVSREVRVFPLVALDGEPSPHVDPVIAEAEAAGWQAEVVPVDYAFQRGADRMLRLWSGP
jgi:ubiquinone/menaquinone biosynthesis C-methylase UbiE